MTATLLERSVRRTLTRLPADRPGTADGDLLARFRDAGDPAAFADLVARHGPTVLGVCRRVLGDRHAAEDAFQATFLVLARRADAVRPPDRVGAFLYGVAYRTALKARGRVVRRQQVEREWGNRAARPGPSDPDVLAAVDQALNALPEKYRLPLLLCGVEGLGKKEAADRLGWAEGTVSSRLARGRDLLRDRLTRRGFAVPAAAIAALLTPDALRAAVPPSLSAAAADTGSAGPAVLALSTEVVRSMALIKWKLVAAVAVAVGLAGGGVGLFAAKAEEKKPAAAPADKPKEGEKPKPVGEKPPTPDQKRAEEKKVVRTTGRVAAVDAAAGTVTIGKEGDKKNEQVVKVAADAKVSVDGKPAELKDIPVGALAEVGFVSGTDHASDVRAAGRRLSGVVAKVDGSTVTLEPIGTESKTVESFTVGPNTQLMVDGKEGKGTADDLKPGMRVGVQVSVDGKTAVTLKAGKPGTEGEKKPEKKPAPEKPKTEKPSPEKPKPAK